MPRPKNDRIEYTSTDGKVVTPYSASVFGATILTNTYEGGKGTISFNNDVSAIGNQAFRGKKTLLTITIPNSVTSIGTQAFSGCTAITGITIPANVISIGSNAFQGCSKLETLNFSGTKAQWYNVSLGSSWKGNAKFSVIHCSDGDVVLAAYINTYSDGSVKYEDSISNKRTLVSSVINEGQKSVARSAYEDCYSLTAVTIPNSVTSIENTAFSNCSALVSITIPASVTSIGQYAFQYCSSLSNFSYQGTKAQWNNVSLGGSWKTRTAFTVVHCSDGDSTRV